ncbi:MAG: hypothetical protein U0J70_10730, partial [Atopobiaceae bacterium]|nr:hypothetical protein [Atopobiaceae bacterium]
SVSHICEKAFAGACDTWQSIPQLSTVIIEDGIEPLDIDWRAFDNSFAPGGTMRLPKRTANLAAEAFPEKRNYYVYNENVQIAEGVFPWESQSTVYYPDTAADDSAIVLHKNSCAQAGRPTEFLPFEVIPRHDIEGTVPAGASVAFYVGGNKTEVDLEDGTSLRTRVEDGSIVRVVVSLDGYADYTLQPSNDGKLLDDWSFNVQESALTPIHTTGDLAVTVTKNHLLEENRIRAAIGCNVVVFNGLGKMVAHGTTSTSTMYFANGLSAGTYTVVAFDKNEYFSVVSGLDDFARLGVAPGSWVTAQATIEAGKTTNLSLEVPEFSVLSAQTLLESGSVVLTDARIVQGLPFSARISLKMKDGHEATKVQVSIPQGIALQSVNSQGHAYGTSGFDASTRILSIDLRDADKKSTTIYLGLLATGEAASSSSLSASVASGAATAPLGSAIVDASGLMLEVPQGRLSSPTFTAEVYAAPKTTVRFRVGQTDLDTQVTTNLAGHATATLTIPEAEMDVFSFYAVTALATGEDGTELWTTERIEYEAGVSSWSTREWELSFVHGGKVNYLVKDGVPEPNPYYTCYALVGHAPGFYSPTWPFTSIIDSDRALANKQTLTLKMLDGTMRSETMTLVKKQPLEGDTVRYTYLASVPFGDGNPFHDLLAKDIPCGFEVVPEYEDLDTVPEPPALTQANINNIKLLLRKKSTDLQNRVYALREAHAAEDPNFDSEGILESHIFSGEYRNVMADMGRIVDPDVRQAILSSTEISEQLREAFREKYEEVDELNA